MKSASMSYVACLAGQPTHATYNTLCHRVSQSALCTLTFTGEGGAPAETTTPSAAAEGTHTAVTSNDTPAVTNTAVNADGTATVDVSNAAGQAATGVEYASGKIAVLEQLLQVLHGKGMRVLLLAHAPKVCLHLINL